MTNRESPVRGKVLIIDDDHMVGRVLVAHVRAAGFDARVTDDAEEFIETAAQWKPTFVFVDLVMGKTDGLTVLSRLAEAGSEAAVVISSGMGSRVLDAARQFAAASGLAYGGLLSKPFTRADVAAVLSTATHLADQPEQGGDLLGAWSAEEFESALREAAAGEQMTVAFQPKINCKTGEPVGYEALVRWAHPELGNVPPIAFVPWAESMGIIEVVTDKVAADALGWFAASRREKPERLAINISATELTAKNLEARLLQACISAGVPAERVILEVTETSAVTDATASLEVLTRLRLDGFQLSIDDFGTGYSSMTQLSSLPFTEVKVDRSFVKNLGDANAAEILVKSMLELARALDLECTAEGVEDERALQVLRGLGCDFAQGYHIARPMPGRAVEEWLVAR